MISSRRDRALRRIDDLLTADLHPEVAYPLRARLGRAVLAAADWLTEEREHLDEAAMTQTESAIADLKALSRRIMQPSEPFDSLWQDQWTTVLETLTKLRQQVATN